MTLSVCCFFHWPFCYQRKKSLKIGLRFIDFAVQLLFCVTSSGHYRLKFRHGELFDKIDDFFFRLERESDIEMANRSQAEFMRQMLRLRARHQVRTPHELLEQAGPIEHHMSKQPKVYDERYCNISNSPLIQVMILSEKLSTAISVNRLSKFEFSNRTCCCASYAKWVFISTNIVISTKACRPIARLWEKWRNRCDTRRNRL